MTCQIAISKRNRYLPSASSSMLHVVCARISESGSGSTKCECIIVTCKICRQRWTATLPLDHTSLTRPRLRLVAHMVRSMAWGFVTFLVVWCCLSFLIFVGVPMDPTGDSEYDSMEEEVVGSDKRRLEIGLIVISAAIGYLAGRRRYLDERSKIT